MIRMSQIKTSDQKHKLNVNFLIVTIVSQNNQLSIEDLMEVSLFKVILTLSKIKTFQLEHKRKMGLLRIKLNWKMKCNNRTIWETLTNTWNCMKTINHQLLNQPKSQKNLLILYKLISINWRKNQRRVTNTR